MEENQQNVTDNSQLREETAKDENRPSTTEWENVNPSGQGTIGLTCSGQNKHKMLWTKDNSPAKIAQCSDSKFLYTPSLQNTKASQRKLW